MEYNKLIADMHTGDDVEGFYVLKDAVLKTTAAGKPFLSGVLADRSGVIDPGAGVGIQERAAADGGPHPHGGRK